MEDKQAIQLYQALFHLSRKMHRMLNLPSFSCLLFVDLWDFCTKFCQLLLCRKKIKGISLPALIYQKEPL